MLEVIQIPFFTDNYAYLLLDKDSRDVVLIDPAGHDEVIKTIKDNRYNVKFILNTHHHHDHVGGNQVLSELYDCPVIGYKGDKHRIPCITDTVDDGDVVSFNGNKIQVILTVGHTTGSISYYLKDYGWLFCGDLIFSAGCARIFEGTYQQLYDSLHKVMSLPDETQIYSAHEYTKKGLEFAMISFPDKVHIRDYYQHVLSLRKDNIPTIPTTLAREKVINPFMIVNSIEDFTKLRQLRDNF